MMNKKSLTLLATIITAFIFVAAIRKNPPAVTPKRAEVLFLGHKNNRNHNSELLADIMTKEYFKSGINISFTTEPDDLNEKNLNNYDGLIVYANHDTIGTSQAKALLDFVRSGKGF